MHPISSDEQFGPLTLHSVAFVKSVIADNRAYFTPAGSGTLVQYRGHYGVVTAAHVVEDLEKAQHVAIFGVHHRKRPFVIDLTMCKITSLYGKQDGEHLPDIAFVRLPEHVISKLKDNYAFYNLEKKRNPAAASNLIVCGVPAALSVDFEQTETGWTHTHFFQFAHCKVERELEQVAGFDAFVLEVQHNDSVRDPSTYGGMSGSGVWGISDTGDAESRCLIGVVYFQIPSANESRLNVVCQGPASLYERLLPAIETTI